MRIKQRINNLSVKRKIIFYSYIVITPILLLISTVLFFKNYNDMNNSQNTIGITRAENLEESMESLNRVVSEVSTYICINSDIEKLLTAQNVEEINKDSQLWLNNTPISFIMDTLAIKGHIKTIAIYPENGIEPYLRCMDASSYMPTIGNMIGTQLYKKAIETRGKIGWEYIPKTDIRVYRGNRSDKVVMYREIFDLSKSRALAFVVIGVDVKSYNNLCNNALANEDDGTVLLNENGKLISSSENVDEKMLEFFQTEEFKTQYLEKEIVYFKYGDSTIYIHQNDETKLSACVIVSNKEIGQQLLTVAYSPLLLLIGFLIGLYPVLIFVSNKVTKPLSKVQYAMTKFRQGDFSQQVDVDTTDEVGEVAACFNLMVTDIKRLIDDNYVMQIKERESELIALQAQINPHFLYNTLDTLYWQAVNADNEEIAENILALSNLFRLVLGEGKGIIDVELEENLINEYLKIQKMRFTKRLNYKIEIEDSIKKEKIPKMILQPFVENSVVHGFENTDLPCELYVSGRRIENGIEFEIRDTGIGMNEQQIHDIFEIDDAERYKGQRIGRYAIKNVMERLELKYHDKFELKVNSKPGEGTQVYIRIFNK